MLERSFEKDSSLGFVQGIAINNLDQLYVTDFNEGRILKFDSDGKLLLEWGSKGTLPGQMHNPTGIAIDGDDNVYVTEFSVNMRVQKFDSDGNFSLNLEAINFHNQMPLQ